MKVNPIRGGQETLCIKVPKVYDWVTRQADIHRSFNGLIGLDELNFECKDGYIPDADPCLILDCHKGDSKLGIDCHTLNVECIITDAAGKPVDPEAPGGLICKEITDPRNRESFEFTLPTGDTVTLQKVKVLKKGFFIIKVSNGKGGVCYSDPQPFATVEKFFLCAPTGTKLQCEITDFQCEAVLCCNDDGTFNQVEVAISMCQNIQMEALVKLEITADFCQPRQEIPFECPPLPVPPQCPDVFPGNT
ncbi:hypothetical protein [Alkalihalobacterium chitinilyticum]|uniref:DUF3794 domain-containing protein n=1 Tax=Alkalihalobacterium chitinilyticum TaxID=2980103 RepID=A0ABT5VB62_9BACI|nr:hypothetical protein [Alkalihalobacterium chitinilyticum]MDE5412688.1 hypothetical protein [Alkalihalobacterium chitinilyticum]